MVDLQFNTGENRTITDERIAELEKPYIVHGVYDLLRMQKENPALFITELLYCSHMWVCPQYDFYIKIQTLIKRIEDKVGKKLVLKPMDDHTELPDDNFQERLLNLEEFHTFLTLSNMESITEIIECKRSGLKENNKFFLDSNNEYCSTEKVVINYLKSNGYKVIYAENNFWKPLAILSYFEECYSQDWSGVTTSPNNIYTSYMYKNNKQLFDAKTQFLKTCNIADFIKEQIKHFGFLEYNVFRCMGTDYIDYILKNGILFLEKIPNDIFVKIVSRMITYMAMYGRGLPDLLAYKNDEICFIEVKRAKEKLREAQQNWIIYLRENNIPIKIIRVKGI